MYLTKKFKKLGPSAAALGLALASCQLIVACSDDGSDDDGNAGSAGASASAGRAGNTSKAGSGAGGKAGNAGSDEGDAGQGDAGSETGGTSGEGSGGTGGLSGGTGGLSGGAGGTAGKAGSGGTAGSGGSGGTAGSAGKGGTGGSAGSSGSAGSAGSAGSSGSAGSAGKGGSGGTAGSVGTAGSAGSAGSAGKGGSGGMSGGGGSAGSSGSGGGSICGNNIVEADEVCDPRYTVNNCGKDCKAITSPACLACDVASECVDYVNCSQLPGNAVAGSPAAGVPKANLCNEVLDCVRDSGCAAGGKAVITCYCGTASGTDCQNGLGNGACKAELERSLETSNFALITQRIKSPDYGGGIAMLRIDCEQQVCYTACGLL